MRIDVFSPAQTDAQASRPKGTPGALVCIIEDRPGELDEPCNLIRAAARAITTGKLVDRRESVTATKGIALLLAASLRAKSLGRWSMAHEYDPRADFLKLDELARTKLGPPRGPGHVVTLFRTGIAETIRVLGDWPTV